MRLPSLCLLGVLAVACARPPATPEDLGAPAEDSASQQDAGSAADAGAVDAGTAADAGGADGGPQQDDGGTDAGPPPPPSPIRADACPASPALLWTRTFSDEVDFRGVADEAGNLYWVEYDPPPTPSSPGSPWLASADRDGRDR